ncbi:hypothetical protein VTP01DRAFT_3126 [Rhizomucor pusillus]|uniref:uncharacterized protein n=1 Tax=Rhizomucor pusillus TaxID=4840 RepID=UPI003744906E
MSIQIAGKFIAIVSTLFLAHSAYSTYEHLAYLKAVDQADTGVPVDIVVECLTSAFVTLFGVVLSAAPFKDISLESHMAKMTVDKIDTAPSFVAFNHRRVVSTSAQLDRKL